MKTRRSERQVGEEKVCMELPWKPADEFLHRVWERRVQDLSHVRTDLRCLDRKASGPGDWTVWGRIHGGHCPDLIC